MGGYENLADSVHEMCFPKVENRWSVMTSPIYTGLGLRFDWVFPSTCYKQSQVT